MKRADKILTFILAGGKGTRLYPLTRDRTKPAVPFGGRFRIIDFVLSSCINSGLRQIYLLTQTKSLSLENHLRNGWSFFNHELGEFITPVPAQQRVSESWYSGTADAIYQNIHLLEDHRPEYVMILSGDHIYNMDFNEMFQQHLETDADMTISVLTIQKNEASEFGVLAMNKDRQIYSFLEKPQDESLIPGEGTDCHINMGIYLFKTEALVRELANDARQQSSHDFGKNIIPNMLDRYKVSGFVFEDSSFGDYWRDVGTLRSYYQANMDFLEQMGKETFSTYDWRIRTMGEQLPPAFYKGSQVTISHSSIGTGSFMEDCSVKNSVIGRNVHIGKGSVVENAIIFSNCVIGENCTIKNAIFDNEVNVPDGYEIGVDPEKDSKNFYVSDGIVVLPKNYQVENT